jgi:hypothetical protein
LPRGENGHGGKENDFCPDSPSATTGGDNDDPEDEERRVKDQTGGRHDSPEFARLFELASPLGRVSTFWYAALLERLIDALPESDLLGSVSPFGPHGQHRERNTDQHTENDSDDSALPERRASEEGQAKSECTHDQAGTGAEEARGNVSEWCPEFVLVGHAD